MPCVERSRARCACRRRKQAKAEKEEDKASARGRREEGDKTASDTDDDGLSSIAGLSALSSLGKRNHLSVQELGVSWRLRGQKQKRERQMCGFIREGGVDGVHSSRRPFSTGRSKSYFDSFEFKFPGG